MSFITWPLFLGGAIAASVPILLHLIMRSVPKRIEFPALRFLQRKRKMNQRKFRLRHLLLLALRVGIFVLLGLALARPSLRWDTRTDGAPASGSLLAKLGPQKNAPIAAAIVIDNSVSMDYQNANKTRLELAQAEARWLLSQLPDESEIAVLSGARTNDMFQIDMFSAAERIDRLSTIPDGRTVGESVAAAVRLLETSPLDAKEMYVFTDLTQSGWKRENAESVRSQLDNVGVQIGVYIIDLGVTDPNDTGITNLGLSGEVISAQGTLSLDAEVTHFGTTDSRIAELVLIDSDRQEQRRSSEVVEFASTVLRNTARNTAGHALKNITFILPNLDPGIHQGMIRFTTSDAFPADDQRFFTVEVQSAWKVLLVVPTPTEQRALFLRGALDPEDLRKQGGSSFQTNVFSYSQWTAAGDAAWNDYRAMILLDPPELGAATWKKLSDYASNGHGVGVFLGRRANPIRSFQSEAAVELLGAKPLRQSRSEDGVFLAPSDFSSVILTELRPFGDTSEVPWSMQPVFRYWELGELSKATNVEIRYSDGRPAIVSKPIGRGVSVLCTTPISDGMNETPWNYLPVGDANWIFLALADGIGQLLVGAGDRTYNLFPGQTAIVPFPQGSGTLPQGGTGTLPNSSILTLPDASTSIVQTEIAQRLARFGATDQIGNYRLRTSGGPRFESGFSVNLRKDQLDLTRLEARILDDYFGEKKYRIAKDRTGIEIVVAKGRVGQELFTALLLCLSLLFIGEYVFSNWFYSRG